MPPPDQDVLRMVTIGMRDAIYCVNGLAGTDYDSALGRCNHHIHEAIHELEEWARANGIEPKELV